MCVTPDGRRVVSWSHDDAALRVCDLETGACLRTLQGHSGSVWSVSVTPDGRRAVSASEDKTLRVWDLESGRCVRTLEGHSDPIWDVSVTPEGRQAVSWSHNDAALRVWDLETGACLGAFVAAAQISSFASSSGLLAIGTRDGQVLLVDMRNLPSGPAIAPESSKAAHEASLRRGLEHSRREKSPNHEEILAHLAALAAHFERIGKADEARLLHEEYDNIKPQVARKETHEPEAHRMRAQLRHGEVLALIAYQFGDYAWVERLLRLMIANCFELPNTRCRLCLILLMQDRFAEAVSETTAAWEDRAEAPSYVIPRILWLQLVLLYTSPTQQKGMKSAPVILGQLKTALARQGAHKDEHREWTMYPSLAHLESKLPAQPQKLLAALVAALNDAANLPALEQFRAWRSARAKPL